MPIANLPLESAAYQSLNKPYEAAHLRWAEFKDIAKLVELYNRARAEAVEDTESMEDWLEHGGALILEDARGDMLCALRYREEGSGWRVDRIATHPNARSQGYGRWLMTKVEALAIRTNIPTLTLTLDEVRDDLVQYYQRMGYRVREQSADELTLEKRVGGMWQYKR